MRDVNADKSVTAKASLSSGWNVDEPLMFPTWSEVLAGDAAMKPDAKSRRKYAIMGLLKYCKVERRPVSITLIKGYLEGLREQGKLVGEAREAFLWFVAGAKAAAVSPSLRDRPTSSAELPTSKDGAQTANSEKAHDPTLSTEHPRAENRQSVLNNQRGADRSMPSIGAEGLDGPEWEQALVRAARVAGLAWRTEVTYRQWATRFVEFMKPKGPRLAEKGDDQGRR